MAADSKVIQTRNDLLSAIRMADLSPQGLQIGPVAFVNGKSILFGAVTNDLQRRALLNKIKLAASRYFAPGTIWEFSCSGQTKSVKQPLKSTKTKPRSVKQKSKARN